MQLPDRGYPAEMTGRIRADIAEQVQEFRRHGYDIVLVGQGGGITAALADVGVPAPDQVIPANPAELRPFPGPRPEPRALPPGGRPARAAGRAGPHGLAARRPRGAHPGPGD